MESLDQCCRVQHGATSWTMPGLGLRWTLNFFHTRTWGHLRTWACCCCVLPSNCVECGGIAVDIKSGQIQMKQGCAGFWDFNIFIICSSCLHLIQCHLFQNQSHAFGEHRLYAQNIELRQWGSHIQRTWNGLKFRSSISCLRKGFVSQQNWGLQKGQRRSIRSKWKNLRKARGIVKESRI